MQRCTLTPGSCSPRAFRDRPTKLAPKTRSAASIFGLGQTKPTKRACWTDVNDKKNPKKKRGVQHEDFPGGHPS